MSAADIARALALQPAGRGVWRGPCPCCGGSRRLQVREGRTEPLLWCWGGCDRRDLLGELRRRGLLPERTLAPEERRRLAEEWRRRDEARAFAGAAAIMAEVALEQMPSTDPRRADLTQLQLALGRAPEAEAAWFKQHRPELFRALVAAWARHSRRTRARTWDFIRVVEALDARGMDPSAR